MVMNALEDKAKSKLIEGENGVRSRIVKTAGKDVEILSLDGMVNDQFVAEYVIESVIKASNKKLESAKDIYDNVVFGVGAEINNTFIKMQENFFNGYTLVFCGDENSCVAVDTRTLIGRDIVQPPTSNITKGPREGFVESIKQNIGLIRKRLKCPDFKIENLTVGRYTNTAISVCYIRGVAAKSTVDVILQKISSIDVDGILDASYVSRFLDESGSVMFKMVGTTEKPDIVAARLLEGRVAVVVDGSPIVLTLPYMLVEDLQSPEDYYEVPSVATMARILRVISVIGSLLLPALYVSLQMYNYHIIPAKFLVTIINASEPIPFTPFSEMVIVLVLFDILREANARMPSIVGLSLSIIGAVILGDAAVKAGLLAAPAVMIGALSSIGLYTLPDNTLLLTLLRLLLAFVGGIMGILGIILSMLLLLSYMVSIEAYGTPYMAPFAPNIVRDRKDAVAKKGITRHKTRPLAIKQENLTRQGGANQEEE